MDRTILSRNLKPLDDQCSKTDGMGMVSIKISRVDSLAHAIGAKQITVNIKAIANFTDLRHLSRTLFSYTYFSIEKIRTKLAKKLYAFQFKFDNLVKSQDSQISIA